MKKIVLIFSLFTLVFCTKEKGTENTITNVDSVKILDSSTEEIPDSLSFKKLKINILENQNREILELLKSKNYVKFAENIHPKKGVRFSMYGYIDPKKDKLFSKKEFLKYIETPIKFTWGEKDGTGNLLQLSLKNYLENWVFVKDFSKSEFSENSIIAKGNSINNIKEIYPNASFTENYLKGTEKYGGMDWNSLRFVFEELNGELFIIGIINDQWTS